MRRLGWAQGRWRPEPEWLLVLQQPEPLRSPQEAVYLPAPVPTVARRAPPVP